MSNILISTPPTSLATGLLQLDNGVAISSTPVYVADQTNTDSKLALSTTSVNVNTTSGSALVNIKGTGSTISTSSLIVQNSAGTNSMQILDNTNIIMGNAIKVGAGGSITNTSGYVTMINGGNASRIGPELFSTDSGSWTCSVLNGGPTLTMSVFGYANFDKNLGIGSPASITARLHVKGSGSTSATTSLLVQNSSSTNLLKVTDDNVTSIIGRASVGVSSIANIWSGYTEALQVGQMFLGGYSPTPQSFIGSNQYFDGTTSKYFRTGGAGNIGFQNDGSIQFDMTASGTAGNTVLTANQKNVYFGVSGNNGIGTISPTSRLHIVGNGSTSSTYSLLIQNSASTQLLRIRDDNYIEFGGGSLTNYNDNSGVFNIWDARPNYCRVTQDAYVSTDIRIGKGNSLVSTNMAFGYQAMNSITSGAQNMGIGYQSLNALTTGNYNVTLGYRAMYISGSGTNNTAIGSLNSALNSTGSNNVSVGYGAHYSNSTGSNNTLVGYNCQATNFDSCVVLGRDASANGSNQFVVGSASYNAGTVVAGANVSTQYWNVKINGVDYKILLA